MEIEIEIERLRTIIAKVTDAKDNLLDEVERLRKEHATLTEFARNFIRANCWDDSEPDGGDVQDMATRLGILVEAEGGYDPEKHGCDAADYWGSEKGDPYYEFAPFVQEKP